MSNYSDNQDRDYRVILAWIILALQVIGLVWLLLFGQDQLAALTGDTADRVAETADLAEATATPAAVSAPAESTTSATEVTATVSADTADATPTAPPASTAAEDVIGPESVLIESASVAPEWLAILVQGGNGEDPAMPPHLLLTFVDPDDAGASPAAPDSIDLTRPQVRIIPIAALLSLLEQRGDEAGARALNELLLLLERQPDTDQTAIPVPPLLGDATQNFVAQAGYKAFGGGSGIGYLTNITDDDALPVTNEAGLNYIYQGVTADGKQYVFMAWPVDAAFLPEDQADAVYETEMLETDRDNYYAALQDQLDSAAETDLTPAMPALSDLVRSLSIDGLVADAEAPVIQGTGFDAVGFTWNWTGSTPAGGEESTVANPQDYSLVLWPDGTYSVKADCNVGGGKFTYDAEGSIGFNPGPLSRAACPEGSREAEFVQSLLAAQAIGFNESGDMLLDLEDGGTMILANVGPVETGDGNATGGEQPAATEAGLAGVTLQWPGYTDAAGNAVTVANPEDYLLTLLPDGTFNLVADCNFGSGAYTFGEDGALQLGPIRLTRMACPDGSLGDEFIAFLEGATGATVEPDGAVTVQSADGRSAIFANLGDVATSDVATSDAPEEAAAQPTPAGDPLNTVWQWTALTAADGAVTPIDNPESYFLVLIDDGTYAFRADCNNGAGAYTLDGDNLTLGPAAVTLAACGADSQSEPFVNSLALARTLGFDPGGNLLLTLEDGAIMGFADGGPFAGTDTGALAQGDPVATDPLAGTTWQWTHFRDAKQDFDVSGAYTITFNADGTVAVVADCNTGSGTYEVFDGAGLAISIRAVTAAACPAGSLGQTFVENLNFAGLFTVNGGELTIEIMADGGTMTFRASQ